MGAAQHGTAGIRNGADPTAAAMAAAAAAGAAGWEELFSSGGGGTPSAAALAGGHLELVAFGAGPATLLSGSAWQMSSMWLKQQQQQVGLAPSLPATAATAVTAAAAEVLQGLVVTEAAAVAAAAAAAAAAPPVVLPVGQLALDVGEAAGGAGGVAELLPQSPSGAGGSLPVQVEAA